MLDRSTRELIDTERYPVESLESERGRELVEGCRASVEDHALCLLPGFVPSEIVQQMVKETAPAIGEGFPFENQRPAYADDGNRWSTDSSTRDAAPLPLPADPQLSDFQRRLDSAFVLVAGVDRVHTPGDKSAGAFSERLSTLRAHLADIRCG